MPIKCSLLTLARYAVVSEDSMLTIAGTMDTVQVSFRKPAPDAPDPAIPIPPCYLVFCITGSLADGLRHDLTVGIRHEDHEWVVKPHALGTVDFKINARGRALKAQGIVELTGMVVPKLGDYEVVIGIGGKDEFGTPLYVDTLQSP